MKDETVWLSLEQISKLFGRDRTVITRHINNIFKEKELEKKEVCAKFTHTTSHGALSCLTKLNGCEAHATYLVDSADKSSLKNLKINLTCESEYMDEL